MTPVWVLLLVCALYALLAAVAIGIMERMARALDRIAGALDAPSLPKGTDGKPEWTGDRQNDR